MNINEFYNLNKKRTLICNDVNNVLNHIAFTNYKTDNKIVNLDVISFKNFIYQIYYDYLFANNIKDPYKKIINDLEAIDIADNIIRDNKLISDSSVSYETSRELYHAYKEIVLGSIVNKNNIPVTLSKFMTLYDEYCLKNKIIDNCNLTKYISTIVPKEFFNRYDNSLFGVIMSKYYRYHELNIIKKFTNTEEINIVTNNPNLSFYKAYGLYSEINNVIDIIEKQKLPYGSVDVYYTDSKYENTIKALFQTRNIPFTISNNLSSNNSIYFMINILEFVNNDFTYYYLEKAIKNLSINNSNLFNQYSYYVDKINHGINSYLIIDELKHNDLFEFIKGILKIFNNNKSFGEIISDLHVFSKNYITEYEYSEVIDEYIDELKNRYENYPKYIDIDRVKDDLKKISVLCENDLSKVRFIKFNKLQLINRENVFFVGMSNQQAKINSNESPFIEDQELVSIFDSSSYFETSKNKVEGFNDELKSTILSSLYSNVFISYSFFDTVELKDMSPSSVFLELSKGKDTTKVNKYILNKNDLVISKDILQASFAEAKEYLSKINRLSPSGLEQLDCCPLHYIYSNIFKLPELDYRDEGAINWLEANEKGNFVHSVLEKYANSFWKNKNIPEFEINEYEKIFADVAKEFETRIPCLDERRRDQEKVEIYNALLAYIENEQNKLRASDYRVLFTEFSLYNYSPKFELKDSLDLGKKIEVNMSGKIDRIDYVKNPDGTFHIAIKDYKTGSVAYDNKFQPDLYSNGIREFISTKFNISLEKVIVDSFKYVHLFPEEKEIEKECFISSPLEIESDAGEIAYNINNNKEISGLLDSFYKNSCDFIYMNKNNCECHLGPFCKYKNICYLLNKYGLFKKNKEGK